jgi:hypothetical protein
VMVACRVQIKSKEITGSVKEEDRRGCARGEGYDVQRESNVGCHLLTDSITTV